MCITCPEVTTKKQKKVLDAPGIGVTGINVGTKSDALKEQEMSLAFERSLQTVYCHYWEVYFDISCCSISGRGNHLCTFSVLELPVFLGSAI